jgi:hypothetical protein
MKAIIFFIGSAIGFKVGLNSNLNQTLNSVNDTNFLYTINVEVGNPP